MTKAPYADIFPRWYELKAAVPDPTHPDAYFQNFERELAREDVCHQYMKYERPFGVLDSTAWRDLKRRAAPLTVARHPLRGWQALFDTLNEAKGYAYLHQLGCTDIAFIKRDTTKAPDLRASADGRPVFCAVKTINVSQDEIERRAADGLDVSAAFNVPLVVTPEMLSKVGATVSRAIQQLDYADPTREAQRYVFTVLHFDDWAGDYQSEYFAQLDGWLRANLIVGAELVFSPASNLFERTFTMRTAAVVEL